MQKDKKTPTKADSDILLETHPFALIGFGELLLMISLALDGFTGAIQDRMNTYHTTKTHSMMYNINIWSCLWLFLGKKLQNTNFNHFIEIFIMLQVL